MRNKFLHFTILFLFLMINFVKAQTVLNENFKEAYFPPTGWVLQNGGNSAGWLQNTSGYYYIS